MDSKSSYKSAQSEFYHWTKKWTQDDENSVTNRTPDLVDFITIFQILGFSITHLDAFDPQEISNCDKRGLKMNISCNHSGVRFVLEGVNVCSCPRKMVDTARATMINPDGKQRKESYQNFRLLDVPDGEKLVIQTVITHLVEMMHSATKHNDQNQNIEKKFQNVATESETPIKTKPLEQYFTPDIPANQEIIEKKPEAEIPMSPTRYRSLDTLTGRAPPSEFPEPGKLIRKEVTTDTYNVPTVTCSSPESNESLKAKKTVLLSSKSDSNLLNRNTKKSSSSSTTTSTLIRPNTTRKLSARDSPKSTTSKTTSSGSKSQKYAHIKSTIPKLSTSKKP